MNNELLKIEKLSKNIRKNILDMAFYAGASSSHFGGALSIVDIISVLFGNKMKFTGGDLSGMWSANVTGGFKMNYPWPLHDGPGASVSFGV